MLLERQEIVAVCPPRTRLPAPGRLPVAKLRDMPLVTTPRGLSTRDLLDRALATAGVEPLIAVETSQREAIAPLVLAGAGTSFLPAGLAKSLGAQGAVVARLVPTLTRTIGLVHRPAPLTPAARAFVELPGPGGPADRAFAPAQPGRTSGPGYRRRLVTGESRAGNRSGRSSTRTSTSIARNGARFARLDTAHAHRVRRRGVPRFERAVRAERGRGGLPAAHAAVEPAVRGHADLHASSPRRSSGICTPACPYVIGIGGSVAAGKSTIARLLQALLGRWPDHPRSTSSRPTASSTRTRCSKRAGS